MANKKEHQKYRAHLADELHSAAIYETLSKVDKDPERRNVFLLLAQSERQHAQVWLNRLASDGVVAKPRFNAKTLVMKGVIHILGPKHVLPSLAAAEFADRNKYAGSPETAGMSAEEHEHANVVQAMANVGKPTAVGGPDIAQAESWHHGVSSGNDLRAGVLGANDGLVSNFCLIMGVAGAEASSRIILLTAFAGLVAGACSMALGEWLSVTNARELAQAQVAKEADELEHNPESEENELALIYRAKGLASDEAKRVAGQIMRDKKMALDVLVREELGLDPAELGGNPWSAAGVSFLLFAVGAFFPAMPFLWSSGASAIAQCVAYSVVALAGIGVFTSIFNGRSASYSAVRQILVGLITAAFTFGVGRLLGVAVS